MKKQTIATEQEVMESFNEMKNIERAPIMWNAMKRMEDKRYLSREKAIAFELGWKLQSPGIYSKNGWE